jgi:hypothetical protein
MSPTEKTIFLTIQLNSGEAGDGEELDQQARRLLSEIQELEVETAELVKSGDPPKGAKSGEVVTLGTLAVTLLPVVAPLVIESLQKWSRRAENRTIRIKAQVEDRSIEVEYSPAAMSTNELKRLLNTLTEAIPPAAEGKQP